jgi:dolichol-phosphate mannosyltransferase
VGARDSKFAGLKLVSVVIPVYNEEKNVTRTYHELKRVTGALNAYRFELIFTDNHSTDNTFAILKGIAASDPSVKVARFARNFGFHKSVLTGYLLASGEAAVQIDADLQDPPEMFGPMLSKWEDGYDVVVGVRRQRIENPLMIRMRKLYYRLLRYLGGSHLLVDAGDFRLIDRSMIEKLRRIDDAHLYLRGLISSLARRQAGLPYDRTKRLHDKSKFPIGNLLRMALDGVIAHSTLPLRVAFYVGISIAFFSAALAFAYLIGRLFFGRDWPQGFATTQILLLFGIGLNSMFLGILGEYLGRIYDQVRRRPTTVVEEVLNFEENAAEIERSVIWATPAVTRWSGARP